MHLLVRLTNQRSVGYLIKINQVKCLDTTIEASGTEQGMR